VPGRCDARAERNALDRDIQPVLNMGAPTQPLLRDAKTETPEAPAPSKETFAWHALTPDEALQRIDSTRQGLSAEEAARRLREHGANRLAPPRPRSALVRFLVQFHNVLIYVLLAAATMTAVLAHWVDTIVILGVVLVNAVIGFVQEGKAEKALDAIRNMLSLHAHVRRGGRRQEIAADEVVPGDIVLLASGDKVPADLRLIEVRNLRVEEAALTGESEPVEKRLEPVAADAAIGDRFCMAYSGTLVSYGQAAGVVVATGQASELGRIGAMLEEVEEITTPLLRKMAAFARWLSVVILAVAAAIFVFGVTLGGYAWQEMFTAVVALAVSAIPEGLPTILTVTLAIGVQRMARRNAIIRRLPAVETLGSVTVICSDKTGTLTRNEMTAQRIVTAERIFEVSGTGYAPQGGLTSEDREVGCDEAPELADIARAAALCNDASLREIEGEWRLEGDPTEGALLTLAMKAGIDLRAVGEELPRVDVIPFESEHRFMATLHHDHAGHAFVFVKGAPERVLEMCRAERAAGKERPLDSDGWRARVEALAQAGQRVLALAFRGMAQGTRELRFADVESGMTLLALVAIIDPPREEAIAAVRECRSAGIRVKMITGDHGITARAIGAQLDIGDGKTALTGPELEAIDDETMRGAVRATDVFARASPEHKLRLVQALQANGEIVAMTGDGVNDAPALKRADVGVAMGYKGTEAAKEAGDMVLADDNFASIRHAVEEGRTVYDNLRKAITFLLPVNGGESLTLLAAILAGATLPLTPVQVLWVNMVSSVTLAMALAFEPTEEDVMQRPPRRPNEPVLSPFLAWRVALVSALFLAGVFGMFELALWNGATVEEARTVAVNTLVAMEVFYLFSVRYLRAPSFTFAHAKGTRPVLIAVGAVWVLQLLFTYAPFMEAFFDSRPLSVLTAVQVVLVGVALLIVLELEKLVRRALVGRKSH
jgi:magnesium-transporting ATPase (P-type)